jgi:hypothetical protein
LITPSFDTSSEKGILLLLKAKKQHHNKVERCISG